MTTFMTHEKKEQLESENKKDSMYVITEKSDRYVKYPSISRFALKIEWVDRYGSSVRRIPEEQTKRNPVDDQLTIMGKIYPALFSPQSPFNGLIHEQQTVDRYGRSIFCFRDRFPCFDSDDFFNENRYYWWFFVREGDVLTRIFYEDESKDVFVTEDVEYIETECWKYMKESGFCQPDEKE